MQRFRDIIHRRHLIIYCMHNNLKYLLSIRMIAMSGQVLALVLMQRFFAVDIPLAPVITVFTVLSLVTIYSWRRLLNEKEITEKDFLLQLSFDLVALTILVFYTGGSSNPFIFLFILPIIFAAASMPVNITLFLALAAVACYTFLMFFHVPVGHQHESNSGVTLHIWGMWYGFVLSAGLVAYFVSRIARALRQRDRALAEAREEKLRAEQILTLGSLAAGTAHELGTPLSTMAVLVNEMEEEYKNNPEFSEDLHTIRNEIERCKEILGRMASDAGQIQAMEGHAQALDSYLQKTTGDWHSVRNDIKMRVNFHGSNPVPTIIADQTLTQAIINVLNNAADASSHAVEIDGEWTDHSLTISVRDDGSGLPADKSGQLGHAILAGQTRGLGIGLFLAQNTLKRLGGSIDLSDLKVGGVLARIELPLSSLLAARA